MVLDGTDALDRTLHADVSGLNALVWSVYDRTYEIAALIVVGVVRSIVDSWLGQEIELSREEVVSWSTTAAVAIIEAVTARAR
jgi:hypothetical protein